MTRRPTPSTIWWSFSRDDLKGIYDHIAADDPTAALRMIELISASAFQLGDFPYLGRRGRVAGTRERVVPRSHYLIVYAMRDSDGIDVEAILHTRRQWPPGD